MSSSSYDREFRLVEVLGPEGVGLEPWRDVAPTKIDVSHTLKSERVGA